MPPPKRLLGVILGISIPQLAVPLARVLSPGLLEWGDWRMTYFVELGLSLACIAALSALPLPPGEREKVFARRDLVTVAFLFPGIACLCSVLALGRILWWTDTAWLAYALITALILISAALLFEHYRAAPLLETRWLARSEIMRIALIAAAVRVLLSEQTFGSIGLLSSLGMGVDQFQTLYVVVLLASIAGIAAAALTFRADVPGRALQIACASIAIGAFIDAGSNSLTRPADLYLSQALIGFGALLFIGPAMVIGVARVLLSGPKNFISWIIVFNATQNVGGLAGGALFGTFQTLREKFHSHELAQQIVLTDPLVAQRIQGLGGTIGSVIVDPALRTAEGTRLLGLEVTREANILAFNDLFLVIGALACLALVWGALIQFRMWRLGEPSPVVLLAQGMARAQQPSHGES